MKKHFVFWAIILSCLFTNNCASTLSYQYTHNPIHQVDSGTQDIPVWIDKNFGEEDKIALDDAIKQWNFVFNGYVYVHIVNSHFNMEIEEIRKVYQLNGFMILRVDSATCDFIPEVRPPATGRTLAWTIGVGEGHKIFIIRDRINGTNMLRGVALHEMGHLFGSDHIENEYSLMKPYYDPNIYTCVDEYTAKAVAERRYLPFEKLNYCVYGNF